MAVSVLSTSRLELGFTIKCSFTYFVPWRLQVYNLPAITLSSEKVEIYYKLNIVNLLTNFIASTSHVPVLAFGTPYLKCGEKRNKIYHLNHF